MCLMQVKRDEYVSQAKETYQTAMDSASGTAQSTRSYASDLKDQATNLIQQVPIYIYICVHIHTYMILSESFQFHFFES